MQGVAGLGATCLRRHVHAYLTAGTLPPAGARCPGDLMAKIPGGEQAVIRSLAGAAAARADTVVAVVAAATVLVVVGLPLLNRRTVHTTPGFTRCGGAAGGRRVRPADLRRRLPLTAALVSGTAVLLAIMLDQPQVGAWVTILAFGSSAYHRDRGGC